MSIVYSLPTIFIPFVDSVNPQALNICDLDAILTDLKEGLYYNSNWRDLGLKLGLYDTTLRSIESANSSQVDECLAKCLVKWLQRVDGVDNKGGPTWTTLVKALEQCDKKSTSEFISKYIMYCAYYAS